MVFGREFSGVVTHPGGTGVDTLIGPAAADIMIGGQDVDSMIGGGGDDVLLGGSGDDLIWVADLHFRRVDGGSGTATSALIGAGKALDLTAMPESATRHIENIDLSGSGDHSLRLSRHEVLNISNRGNTSQVEGTAGDTLRFSVIGCIRGARITGYYTVAQGVAIVRVRVPVALPITALCRSAV